MFAEIELLQDASIGGIQQHHVIREIVGNQQPVRARALPRDDSKAGGIRDRSSGGGFAKSVRHLFAMGNLLWRNFQKTLWSNFALTKAVNRDAISSITGFFARRIADRTDGGV